MSRCRLCGAIDGGRLRSREDPGGVALGFSAGEITELVVGAVLASSIFLGALTATLRIGVRPLLEDWARLRAPPGGSPLERRLAEMEEDIRRLKARSDARLPSEPSPPSGPSRV